MDWMKITVLTTTAGADLVSQLLMDAGSAGTCIEDKNDVALNQRPEGRWDILDASLAERIGDDVRVSGYYETDAALNDKIRMLEGELRRVKAMNLGFDAGKLEILRDEFADEDWSESWKASFKPVRLSAHIVVKPEWTEYEPEDGEHVIEIDPGMAFGTGTHETTGMCAELIEKYVKPDMNVIDVGTGTGILAMVAAYMGAKDVLATDIDPVAVRVAEENVRKNGLEGKIRCAAGDLLENIRETADVVVANIIADAVVMLAEPVKPHIHMGGKFICSGIAAERKGEVLNALNAANYQITDILERGEWCAVAATREDDMNSFYIEGVGEIGAVARLKPEDARHAAQVLRMRHDDEFYAVDESGRRFLAEMREVSKEKCTALLYEELADNEADVKITLYMGIPKADKLDLIAQKITELGASRLVPVKMERCVTKLDEKDGKKRQERLEKIAREAAKQCKRAHAPEILPPMTWKQTADAMRKHDLLLVPWEYAQGFGLLAAKEAVSEAKDIGIVIGPEGGMSAGEVNALTELGARTVTLGPRILRAETAAVAACAMAMLLWGDIG